jgi:hypothetical protein
MSVSGFQRGPHPSLERINIKMFDEDESWLEVDREYGLRETDGWITHLDDCMGTLWEL